MPRALIRVLPFVVPLILFGFPWAVLVGFGVHWPTPVTVTGTVLFLAALVGLPALMVLGHRRRRDPGGPPGAGRDRAARVGDFLLGAGWVLFTWSLLGQLLRLALAVAGVADPTRSRLVALAVLVVTAALLGYGLVEALRLPRVKTVRVVLPRLGADLDGLRVVLITDTHFGPIDRTRWSARMARRINELAADVVCHTGDLADGSVAERAGQVGPLAGVRATLGRFYVSGNHEYFGVAQDWLDRMAELGWRPLHNQAETLHRGRHRLLVAGVDDATAAGYGLPGHGADLATALIGADPEVPVLLLAHQPSQVSASVEAGVDLQLSGHTHGGQIWPFHYLVRLDQPVLAGLSRHGARTQLYTSRGSGFWGPPLRVFAPSEITLLVLHSE
ncbi:MAG TPA: metallophosphoesterase [Pseudonocardia sp.]|jgi:hypothetical protein